MCDTIISGSQGKLFFQANTNYKSSINAIQVSLVFVYPFNVDKHANWGNGIFEQQAHMHRHTQTHKNTQHTQRHTHPPPRGGAKTYPLHLVDYWSTPSTLRIFQSEPILGQNFLSLPKAILFGSVPWWVGGHGFFKKIF